MSNDQQQRKVILRSHGEKEKVVPLRINIVFHYSNGMTRIAIGEEVGISHRTVEGHLESLRMLNHCVNTTQLCCLFIREGIIK